MEEQIVELIRKVMIKNLPVMASTGIASNIDEGKRTCDIKVDDDITLFNCRLNAVIDRYESNILILPKDGSQVAYLLVENQDTNAIVIGYTEIDKVIAQIGSLSLGIDAESNQAPCISLVQFQIDNGGLVMTAYQRSSDANLGLPSDMYQLYLISRQLHLPLNSITLYIGNVHIYENNIERTQQLLAGEAGVKFDLNAFCQTFKNH